MVFFRHKLHVVGVVSNVDLKLSVEQLFLFNQSLELINSRFVARDRQTRRAVEACNPDFFRLQLSNKWSDFLLAASDGHHGAFEIRELPLQFHDSRASKIRDSHACIERQNPSCICCADLST